MSKAPTSEEVVRQVEGSGQRAGTWGSMGGRDTRPLFVDRQLELAEKLKAVLGEQGILLGAELQQAREALHRLKHGGGA